MKAWKRLILYKRILTLSLTLNCCFLVGGLGLGLQYWQARRNTPIQDGAIAASTEALLWICAAAALTGIMVPFFLAVLSKKAAQQVRREAEAFVSLHAIKWIQEYRETAGHSSADFWLRIGLLAIGDLSKCFSHPLSPYIYEVAENLRRQLNRPASRPSENKSEAA